VLCKQIHYETLLLQSLRLQLLLYISTFPTSQLILPKPGIIPHLCIKFPPQFLISQLHKLHHVVSIFHTEVVSVLTLANLADGESFRRGRKFYCLPPLNSLSKALFSAGQFVSYAKCTRVVKPSSLVKFISAAVTSCLLSLRKCPRKFPTIVCLTFPPRPLKNTFKRRRCHFAR
jgi:hypothetical protein